MMTLRLHRAMAGAWLCVVLVARAARADDALARVVAVGRWLDGDGPPPAHWEVASKRDLNPRWKKGGGGSNKQVSKTSYGKAKVVVKTKIEHTKGGETPKNSGEQRELLLRAELLFLEYLAGSPGVPKLYGGWLGDGGARVTYVVQDAGKTLGVGMGTVGRPAKPAAPWAAFARNAPVAALRALLECFRSFSEVGGYFLNDFHPYQFTVIGPRDKHATTGGVVYLVDAPLALAGPMRNFSVAKGLTVAGWGRGACAGDGDCPATPPYHCCCRWERFSDSSQKCERGARGAPEAKGKCLKGRCLPVSAKTHVFDIAAKAWALPLVLKEGHLEPAAKKKLRALEAWMLAPDPDDRPNLTEALLFLDGVS